MLLKIFSVHDQKAEAFLPPFYMHHVGQAGRVFTDCINSNDHQFSQHPADYTLFELGTFNDQTAEITSITPKSIGNGVEFIKIELADTPEQLHEKRDEPQLSNDPESGNSAF